MDIVERLPQPAVTFFIAYEYLALLLLFLATEAGIPLPLPSSALLVYAAYLAGQGQGNVFLILLSVVLGMVLGSWLLYSAALRGGHPLLLKYGKYIRLRPEKLTRMETWFNRRGSVAIILGYLMPGIRLQSVIAAGLFRVRRNVFLYSTALAALVWTSFYLCLGVLFGSVYNWVNDYLRSPYLLAAIAVALLAVLATLAIVRRKTIKGKRETIGRSQPHRGGGPGPATPPGHLTREKTGHLSSYKTLQMAGAPGELWFYTGCDDRESQTRSLAGSSAF